MKRISDNKGLTLVEIIVTLAVLGIVTSPLMAMFVTSQKINRQSELQYNAIQIAQEYMEEIKAMEILEFEKLDLDENNYNAGENAFIAKKINKNDGYDVILRIEGAADGSDYDDSEKLPDLESVDINKTITINADSRIRLEKDNLTISVISTAGDSNPIKLFVQSAAGEDYKSTIKVIEGSVKVIKNYSAEKKPDNLLYNIKIKVERNTEEIITIDGTTVFIIHRG